MRDASCQPAEVFFQQSCSSKNLSCLLQTDEAIIETIDNLSEGDVTLN